MVRSQAFGQTRVVWQLMKLYGNAMLKVSVSITVGIIKYIRL